MFGHCASLSYCLLFVVLGWTDVYHVSQALLAHNNKLSSLKCGGNIEDLSGLRVCHNVTCLCSLLSYHIPACSLRSSNTNVLLVPRVHTTCASCCFNITASSVWNSLPSGIHHHIHSVVLNHQAFSSP